VESNQQFQSVARWFEFKHIIQRAGWQKESWVVARCKGFEVSPATIDFGAFLIA
jgi:hypothetical protein